VTDRRDEGIRCNHLDALGCGVTGATNAYTCHHLLAQEAQRTRLKVKMDASIPRIDVSDNPMRKESEVALRIFVFGQGRLSGLAQDEILRLNNHRNSLELAELPQFFGRAGGPGRSSSGQEVNLPHSGQPQNVKDVLRHVRGFELGHVAHQDAGNVDCYVSHPGDSDGLCTSQS
jgi:hypothetical protein